jgi:phage terminase large subunit
LRISLPNGWEPRPYQRPLWNYLERGGKRAIGVWHRRAGKDDVLLHRTAVAAFERVATYWTALPEYAQARKALWAAVNPHTGKRRIDEAFPYELRETTNEQEMFIRFRNGSTWQLIGSDRYNSLVGAGVAGVTFSEFALANPSAWGYIRPMLEENDGWAAFITTPRGRNHAKAMYDMAAANDKWFAETLTIADTGALTPEQVKESLDEYIALYGEDLGTAQFEQEYECSFNAAILGAFYAREMALVRKQGRVTNIEALPDRPVHRAWDIGRRDDTSIWWFQVVGSKVYILDCYSMPFGTLEPHAEEVHRRNAAHGWNVKGAIDYVPHDAKVIEWGAGRTRVEQMQAHGLNPVLAPDATKLDGIAAARLTLGRCVFHSRCETLGLAALEQYRREWDDERKTFKADSVHDWTSHLADAFRYLSLSWRHVVDKVEEAKPMPKPGQFIPPPVQYSTGRRIKV